MKTFFSLITATWLLVPWHLEASNDKTLKRELQKEIVQLLKLSQIEMDENDSIQVQFELDGNNRIQVTETSMDGTIKGKRIMNALDNQKMGELIAYMDRGNYKVKIHFK